MSLVWPGLGSNLKSPTSEVDYITTRPLKWPTRHWWQGNQAHDIWDFCSNFHCDATSKTGSVDIDRNSDYWLTNNFGLFYWQQNEMEKLQGLIFSHSPMSFEKCHLIQTAAGTWGPVRFCKSLLNAWWSFIRQYFLMPGTFSCFVNHISEFAVSHGNAFLFILLGGPVDFWQGELISIGKICLVIPELVERHNLYSQGLVRSSAWKKEKLPPKC